MSSKTTLSIFLTEMTSVFFFPNTSHGTVHPLVVYKTNRACILKLRDFLVGHRGTKMEKCKVCTIPDTTFRHDFCSGYYRLIEIVEQSPLTQRTY